MFTQTDFNMLSSSQNSMKAQERYSRLSELTLNITQSRRKKIMNNLDIKEVNVRIKNVTIKKENVVKEQQNE